MAIGRIKASMVKDNDGASTPGAISLVPLGLKVTNTDGSSKVLNFHAALEALGFATKPYVDYKFARIARENAYNEARLDNYPQDGHLAFAGGCLFVYAGGTWRQVWGPSLDGNPSVALPANAASRLYPTLRGGASTDVKFATVNLDGVAGSGRTFAQYHSIAFSAQVQNLSGNPVTANMYSSCVGVDAPFDGEQVSVPAYSTVTVTRNIVVTATPGTQCKIALLLTMTHADSLYLDEPAVISLTSS